MHRYISGVNRNIDTPTGYHFNPLNPPSYSWAKKTWSSSKKVLNIKIEISQLNV